MEGRTATIEQGTEAWRQIRRGDITSSQVYRLMSDPKSKADKEAGKLSDGAMSYIMELIAEEVAPIMPEWENDAVRWGKDNEPIARYHYQRSTGIIVNTAPYIPCADISGYGGSPDGVTAEQNAAIFGELDRAVLTYEPGCQEIKCPYETANHLWYCTIETADDLKDITQRKGEYYWQCMSNILITNSKWCDFISFDPRIDHDLGLFIFRVQRDSGAIALLEMKVRQALEIKERLMRKMGIWEFCQQRKQEILSQFNHQPEKVIV